MPRSMIRLMGLLALAFTLVLAQGCPTGDDDDSSVIPNDDDVAPDDDDASPDDDDASPDDDDSVPNDDDSVPNDDDSVPDDDDASPDDDDSVPDDDDASPDDDDSVPDDDDASPDDDDSVPNDDDSTGDDDDSVPNDDDSTGDDDDSVPNDDDSTGDDDDSVPNDDDATGDDDDSVPNDDDATGDDDDSVDDDDDATGDDDDSVSLNVLNDLEAHIQLFVDNNFSSGDLNWGLTLVEFIDLSSSDLVALGGMVGTNWTILDQTNIDDVDSPAAGWMTLAGTGDVDFGLNVIGPALVAGAAIVQVDWDLDSQTSTNYAIVAPGGGAPDDVSAFLLAAVDSFRVYGSYDPTEGTSFVDGFGNGEGAFAASLGCTNDSCESTAGASDGSADCDAAVHEETVCAGSSCEQVVAMVGYCGSATFTFDGGSGRLVQDAGTFGWVYYDATSTDSVVCACELNEDADGDGFTPNEGDCNDADATINPAALESCDAIDSNCDNDLVDGDDNFDGDSQPDCIDADDDNDGDDDITDCDDANPSIYTGAPETCDLIDSNCDGDLVDGEVDGDGDGVPDCADSDVDGDGFAPADGDCDDNDASIYPNAPETCDAIDSDCDLDLVDGDLNTDGDSEPDCIDADDDNDGSLDGDDCAELDDTIYPGAPEVCDDIDSDCDLSLVDEDLDTDGDFEPDCIDEDDDNDGSLDGDDCDELDATIYPGAPEVCDDAIDQNCDTYDLPCNDLCESAVEVFHAAPVTGSTLAATFDDVGSCTTSNTAPGVWFTYIAGGGDVVATTCDDADFDTKISIFSGDCSALVCEIGNDDDLSCGGNTSTATFDSAAGQQYLILVHGFSSEVGEFGLTVTEDEPDADDDGDPDSTDCDDVDPTIYTGAPESCDDIDSDCDGSIVDEDPDLDGDLTPDCVDDDVDGDGEDFTTDCDDTDDTVYTGAPELCDDLDNDCDGNLSDDEIDDDGDGSDECDADPDCDDANDTVYPGAPELCDAIDNDCDGTVPADEIDDDLDFLSECNGDCDDTDSAVNPSAVEACGDGIDNDCEPLTIDLFDSDGDGDNCADDCDDADVTIGPSQTETFCDAIDNDCDVATIDDTDGDGDGFTLCTDDCNDSDSEISPAASEVCDDSVDNDCDPSTIDLFDADGDGDNCANDCNDADAAIGPSQSETLCDSVDNDCNAGTADDQDADGDGYTLCVDDCNDADANVSPAELEVCNDSVDNDCDVATIDLFDADGDGDNCVDDCNDADAAIGPSTSEVCDNIDQDCDGNPYNGFPDTDGDGIGDCDDPAGFGDLVITEIMANPTAASDTFGEWFELYNTTGGAVDLLNYVIEDEGSDSHTIGSSVVLGAGEYAVLCRNGDFSVNGGVVCDYSYGSSIALANGEDELYLSTPSGDDVDFVVWDSSFPIVAAASMILDPTLLQATANDLPGNWCVSVLTYGDGDAGTPGVENEPDLDGDGVRLCEGDCDDTDAAINPSATEVCDSIDNNCDGSIDEGLDLDADGDGFNDLTSCADNTDCNDGDASIFPGATEACNGIDDNCDGLLVGATTTYTPTDTTTANTGGADRIRGNRYLASSAGVFTSSSLDIDAAAGVTLTWVVYESSTEGGTYSLIGSASNTTTVSGPQTATSPTMSVAIASGMYYAIGAHWAGVTVGYDSTVSSAGYPIATPWGQHVAGAAVGSVSTVPNSTTFPDFSDLAYGQTVNVNAGTDELDDDGDGEMVCAGDCDDTEATVLSTGTEVCDGLDNDCSGVVDSGLDTDADGDGFNSLGSCAGNTDCDDTNAAINTAASEVCDAVDNNCDGNADEGLDTDADGDGFNSLGSCVTNTDCDDTNAAINPDATEICNGLDDDCDGSIGLGSDVYESPANGSFSPTSSGTYYGSRLTVNTPTTLTSIQGYASTSSNGAFTGAYVASRPAASTGAFTIIATASMAAVPASADWIPSGALNVELVPANEYQIGYHYTGSLTLTYSLFGTDPSWGDLTEGDVTSAAWGAATLPNEPTTYVAPRLRLVSGSSETDNDGDGELSCDGDCDDGDAAVNTSAAEITCDAIDNDCDAATLDAPDGDGDGSDVCLDCDDAQPVAFPGNPEVCDSIDNNCDGSVDEGIEVDADGDGYGDSSLSCLDTSDCNDADPAINPGAAEACDTVDNDCSGSADFGTVAASLATATGNFDNTGDSRVKGDILSVTDPMYLDSMAFEVTAAIGTVFNLAVWEGSAATGDFNLVVNRQVASADSARHYIESGHLGVLMDPDLFYAAGLHGPSGSTFTYYYGAAGAAIGSGVTVEHGIDEGSEPTFPTVLTETSAFAWQYHMTYEFTAVDETDDDGDGFLDCVSDCDDGDVAVYAGAPEACDGVDTDCDGANGDIATYAPAPGTSSSSLTAGLKGNVFSAAQSTTLQQFEQELNATSGDTLTWQVWEGATDTGPWTEVFNGTTVAATSAQAFHPSPQMAVAMDPGMYYAMGAAWTSSTNYYFGSTTAPTTTFGSHEAGITYSSSPVPASPTFSANSLTYNQRLTTSTDPCTFFEGFEGGAIPAGWTTSGDANWFTQMAVVSSGAYAAEGGDIGNSQVTDLNVSVSTDAGGELCFDYTVSSELNWDYLEFRVDGGLIEEWSGTVGWTQRCHTLTPGDHTILFQYDKDGSVTSGDDTARVDNVSLNTN